MLHGALDGLYLAKILHVVHMTCQLIEPWHDINSIEPAVFSLCDEQFHCCQQFPLSHFFLFVYFGAVIIFHLSVYCMIRIFSVFLPTLRHTVLNAETNTNTLCLYEGTGLIFWVSIHFALFINWKVSIAAISKTVVAISWYSIWISNQNERYELRFHLYELVTTNNNNRYKPSVGFVFV